MTSPSHSRHLFWKKALFVSTLTINGAWSDWFRYRCLHQVKWIITWKLYWIFPITESTDFDSSFVITCRSCFRLLQYLWVRWSVWWRSKHLQTFWLCLSEELRAHLAHRQTCCNIKCKLLVRKIEALKTQLFMCPRGRGETGKTLVRQFREDSFDTTMMTLILLVLKVLTCHKTYFATDVVK